LDELCSAWEFQTKIIINLAPIVVDEVRGTFGDSNPRGYYEKEEIVGIEVIEFE